MNNRASNRIRILAAGFAVGSDAAAAIEVVIQQNEIP